MGGYQYVLLYSVNLFQIIFPHKMPGKGSGTYVTYTGTNSQGSTYTQYSDGGYTYKNPGGSRYYNTGHGHGFYHSGPSGSYDSCGQPYSTHYNYNKGYNRTNYKNRSQTNKSFFSYNNV